MLLSRNGGAPPGNAAAEADIFGQIRCWICVGVCETGEKKMSAVRVQIVAHEEGAKSFVVVVGYKSLGIATHRLCGAQLRWLGPVKASKEAALCPALAAQASPTSECM